MTFPNEMLVANAGSGKTFRLTVRTIALLASGVEPEKIAALTFTRKAAGEFLTSVFLRLAAAAGNDQALRDLQRDLALPDFDAEACQNLLRKLTTRLHRLSMGTIDSLFGRIARSFPLETGLAGDFSMLSSQSRNAAMQDTLATLFREQGSDEARFSDFLDVIRQQSRKDSERGAFNALFTEVNNLHEKFLNTPAGTVWGDEKIIWPNGCPIFQAADLTSAADNLWQAIETTHPDLDEKAVDKWKETLQAIRETMPLATWSKDVDGFVKKNPSFDKKTGDAYLPTGGALKARVYLNPVVVKARTELLHALIKLRIEELLRRSRALHGVLTSFEKLYHRLVRRQGMLTFSDITEILAGQVNSAAWRATVGYRLDGQWDHWMLDEFQDTSQLQWRVLSGLVDEVVQDTDGNRSLFYVGDTKQAIYSWRGGDPSLFFEIADHYNRSGTIRIQEAEPLNVSYRSDPEIIDFVNEVYGNLADHADVLGLPSKTVEDWNRAWVTHEVAPKNQKNKGYVRWLPVEKTETYEDEAGTAIEQNVADILLEVRPWERGWSCAVLHRRNAPLADLAAHLQAIGVPVAIEGKANPCIDNPLGRALQAAFRFAASPDDKLSHRLLQCSPFAKIWLGDGDFEFREKLLTIIASDGFSAAVQFLLHVVPLEEEFFLEERAREFLTAAMEFDAASQSANDIGNFNAHIDSYERQEPEGTGVVRFMTVHQAKGLTLDMTIIYGFDDAFAESDFAGDLALGNNEHNQKWGLLMPAKDIANLDEVLKLAQDDLLSSSTYEEICNAYVAMTRPRHALYILTKKLGEKSTSKNLGRLLGLSAGDADSGYENGDSQWFEKRPISTSDADALESVRPTLPKPLHGTPNATRPSSAGHKTAFHSSEALQIGTDVHAALAQIEWLDGAVANVADISEIAAQRLTSFLNKPEAQSVFASPSTPFILWRERAFDCHLDGEWVTGVFDRVLVNLDDAGSPVSAEVIDFKTDQTDSETLEKRHAAQMAIYQKAAALLLGINPTEVRVRLVSVS